MSRALLPVLDFAPPATPAASARPDAAREAGTRNPEPGRFVPHVVAWNLTRRCNLECAHCYISAGSWQATSDELGTSDCLRVLDEVLEVNPGAMLILSGGEPLLRDDLETIAARAAAGGATVVVGTNGTRLTDRRIESLMTAGVRGVAISVDSLEDAYHDRFRHGSGALADTLGAVERLRQHRLDFVVQTSLTRGNRAELRRLVDWAAEMGAVAFNLYFLVATGRGAGMRGLEPAENDAVLAELTVLQREYRGRMLIRSKCQPQIMRHVYDADPDSPLLNYETRCPCGVQYCRITPEGRVTPCPYLPVVAGDLRRQRFADVWRHSEVFERIRANTPGGKCGRCEYREICGGCRARAYADSGDYTAADESCAYEPDGARDPVARTRAVRYGMAAAPALEWSDDARARVERIPSFVRAVVVERVERFARERGHARVTAELMAEVRRALPVDFSKRMPFFMEGAPGDGRRASLDDDGARELPDA